MHMCSYITRFDTQQASNFFKMFKDNFLIFFLFLDLASVDK